MQYLRFRPDGTPYMSDEKPTNPNEPVVTKEQLDSMTGSLEELDPFAEQRSLYGEPTQLEQGRSVFTTPEGGQREYWPGGDLRSITLPTHWSNRYSPKDQKTIEKLYQDRSAAATDPEIDENERQIVLDMIDSEISKVPRLPPTMQEPTAQQKFDASLIKLPDGRDAYIDPKGKVNPIEPSKEQQKKQDEYQKIWTGYYKSIEKENLQREDWETKLTPEQIRAEAKRRADDFYAAAQEIMEQQTTGTEPESYAAISEEGADLQQVQLPPRGSSTKKAVMVGSIKEPKTKVEFDKVLVALPRQEAKKYWDKYHTKFGLK